ncbi:MAG: site-specific DNA-methyltransferase [Candidatus Eremiobacteraeota bacterium]|nr:site-specific DNA-methyltransferase [Candidatus Eremiobacteraeota bacterium]
MLKNKPDNTLDYQDRSYLSAVEAAKYLCCDVKHIHNLIKSGHLPFERAASGQYRLSLDNLREYKDTIKTISGSKGKVDRINVFKINDTTQKVICSDSRNMKEIADNSVHLMVTSPPYFNAKMYSGMKETDLGNIHDLDEWFEEIGKTWKEVFRVLQHGRKAFVNIMNLPIRIKKTFKSLNLTGKTIDLMEKIGFMFKRDIIWHKTNGVKAHFGTYPYPGGILINNMHEFILEFHKPDKPGARKYAHVTDEQKEASKLDKEFWLSLKNTDVWLMKPQLSGDGREHVAPFPYELPYRLIKAYSFMGETVLDPFGGSLITLKVAADLKRNGIAYEINEDIVSRAIKKFESHQETLLN